jgi:hypothetical protein
MIAATPIVLEATAEVSDDTGDVEDSPPDAPASLAADLEFVRDLTRCSDSQPYQQSTGSPTDPVEKLATLADAGIDKHLTARLARTTFG